MGCRFTSIMDCFCLCKPIRPHIRAPAVELRTSQWLVYGDELRIRRREATSPGSAVRRRHQACRSRRPARERRARVAAAHEFWWRKTNTLSASQPTGIGRMSATTRGSRRVPALPVTQHLPPSRLVMALRASVSGGERAFQFRVTWIVSIIASGEQLLGSKERTYLTQRYRSCRILTSPYLLTVACHSRSAQPPRDSEPQ